MTGSGVQNDVFEWPIDSAVVLTLDLECDYGTALETNAYEAATETPGLRAVLEEYDVPLTCFLQTELLEAAPDAVDSLERSSAAVDFHAHSHTHPHPKRADFEYEIEESLDRVADRFSTDVVGYRFPDGAIPASGYRLLADRGVDFSSSLFPTWRPGRFDNRNQPVTPHEPHPGLLELPITPYSPLVRIPVSISYQKVLGRLYQELVNRYPPSVIVFDIHMHDLTTPSTIDELPFPYRMIYERNCNRGYAILRRFIEMARERGYQFMTMSELYTKLETAVQDRPASAIGE